jgi:polyisoprenoid-binding protein YceI
MYQLDPAKTTASFTINEILLGQPNTVVGTTRDVKGSFSLDLGDPAGAEYGPVEINADSFVTDDDRRNGAIRRFILQTNNPDNATVTFQPISVDGLPSSAEVGTDYEVSVTGDLTLHGITQSVTFQGQVSVASADEVQGSLSASVPRADFDLNIPSVPSVADVQETVLLKLDFVASRS